MNYNFGFLVHNSIVLVFIILYSNRNKDLVECRTLEQ